MGKRAAHYTARVAKQICEHIALGSTLAEALEKTGYLAPALATCWRWIDEHADFREMYERARQLQADIHADRMLEISREVLMTPKRGAADYRVAVDILKWQAEVRNRERYGSKSTEAGKNKPLDPAKLRSEIKRLEQELGVAEAKVVKLAPVKKATS